MLTELGKFTCSVSITARSLKSPEGSSPSDSLIRRILKSKSKEYFHAALGISPSSTLKEFESHIEPFVENLEKFSKHSLKSGAASNPGCRLLDGGMADRPCWLAMCLE